MLRPRSEAGPESSEQIMAELRENTLSQLEELYPQFITILSNYNYEGVETITNFEQVIIEAIESGEDMSVMVNLFMQSVNSIEAQIDFTEEEKDVLVALVQLMNRYKTQYRQHIVSPEKKERYILRDLRESLVAKLEVLMEDNPKLNMRGAMTIIKTVTIGKPTDPEKETLYKLLSDLRDLAPKSELAGKTAIELQEFIHYTD